MKKLLLITTLSSLTMSAFAIELKTEEQKLAYTIGTQMGASLQPVNEAFSLDKKVLFDAITESLENKKPQLSEDEMNTAITSMQKKMMKKMKEKAEAEAKANKVEGEKFLTENKSKDGVKETKSGLQYRIINEGKGKKPTASDTVKVKYKGFLPDGTKFDDSEKAPDGSVEFPLNVVIEGWTEGLQLMPIDSKYEFVIPSELAYKENMTPPIGPNRALRFEVELLDILTQKAEEKPEKKIEETKKAADAVKETAEDAAEKTKETVKDAVKKVTE